MRPGEARALDWSDVNLPALRVTISTRLYRGRVDLPKSNKVRVIALTPPARDALLSLPERDGLVFLSKSGGRMCAPLLSSYWREVQAAGRLRFGRDRRGVRNAARRKPDPRTGFRPGW